MKESSVFAWISIPVEARDDQLVQPLRQNDAVFAREEERRGVIHQALGAALFPAILGTTSSDGLGPFGPMG